MKITLCMFDRNSRQLASNLRRSIALALLFLLGYPCVGYSDLVDLGNELIIDTDRKVMWLQDLNYAATTGFDSDGLMSFQSAQAFIAAMNAGVVPNFGFTDWRLPRTLIPDSTCDAIPMLGIGFNCSGSEIGHLYYAELGLLDHQSGSATSHLPFFNLKGVYWSGTEQTPGVSAMVFGLVGGNQFVASEILAVNIAVVPVRDTGVVKIDIKPGNHHNDINPRSKGGIWLAVLSDTDPESPFDPPSQVDIPTVEFGPDSAKAIRHKVKDINKDGLGDLLLRFKIPETGIACGDTESTLTGETFDGLSITGTDSIRTVGCKPKKHHKKHHKKKHHKRHHGN